MTATALHRATLAEHETWKANLEAERVSHAGETHAQLLARLEATERPQPRRTRPALAVVGERVIQQLCDDVAAIDPWRNHA